MRHFRVLPLMLLVALGFQPWLAADLSADAAREAALQFGEALKSSDTTLLRAILPQQGRIRLNLQCLGPVEGFFSSGQAEALFREFLEQGSVRSFEVIDLELDSRSFAIARGRSHLTDREGRPARVDIHLAFQPEGGRWVLREVRETKS
jgi:hypothetical protein